MLEYIDSSVVNVCEGLIGKDGFDMFLAVASTIIVLIGLWHLVRGIRKERKV